MVAVRRVKRVIQFSIFAVFLAALLLFLDRNEISDLEKFSVEERGEIFLDTEDGKEFGGLLDTEREFDVNEILKDIGGNLNGAKSRDDQKKVSGKIANHQAEIQDNNGKEKTSVEGNVDHVDKRQLKQVFNESETPNVTFRTQASGRKNIPSVLLPTPTDNDKTEQQSKDALTHSKDPYDNDSKPASPTWKKILWTNDMLGSLNVHIWQAWCGTTIHDLRRNTFFPLFPDVRLTIKKLFVRHWEYDYGQRIFGYIHPPVTGKYTFAISSDDSSELWLSSNESPSDVKLIAWVGNRTLLGGVFQTKIAQFTKYKTQLSRPVFLHKGQKYFIEVLHKQGRLDDHVLVGWKIPGFNHFRHISGTSISLYVDDVKAPKDVTVYAQYIPQDLPSHSHDRISKLKLDHDFFKFGSDDLRDKAHSAKFVDGRDIDKLFPSCPYNPSYLVDFKLKRYDGVTLIHDTAVYPADNTDLTHMKIYDSCRLRRLRDSHGNRVASLPPKLRSNESLYENGSISVFRREKGFLPLSFAKSAMEREQAVEQLLEMQLDISDIKRRSQKVEDETQPSEAEVSLSLPEKADKENIFEMKKKKRRRKDGSPVKIERRSTLTKDEEDSVNEANVTGKRKNSKEDLQGRSKDETGTRGKSLDVNRTDFPKHLSNGDTNAEARTQRRLLSYNGRVNTPANNNRYRSDYNPWLSRSQSGINSSLPQPRWERIHFYPVDKQDDQLTRMNAAREYVRRMADAVQRYNHRINARALAEAVYKKFGVKLKIPHLFRVPLYNEWIFHQNRTNCASDGNLFLNADVALSIVNRYIRALRKATHSKYSLKEVLNVEENHDVLEGDRYLIDLELNVAGKNSSVRLLQYVYQKRGSVEFCLPQGFAVNQHATVHIIIPVKNQGKWVKHFIENMVELYSETGDPYVNVIIVDFSSTDIDVNAAFERSSLRRYQVRKLKGAFQRAYGIQAGAALVQNPHDIIFMCDLHLQIPSNLVDIIRKHCVLGKMAFAPIVARLHCGFSPSLPFGFWELQGYGLFAMYKADFTRVGGMNYKEFRTTWGGEDWELLDRVLLAKMEVERLRVAKFYHYYHSKKGMWGTRSLFNPHSRDMYGRFDDDRDIIPLYNETQEREKQKKLLRVRIYR